MPETIYPVACPICGECQNILPGGFQPQAEPFGKVSCMVCNHQFSRLEYLAGLARRRQELLTLTGPLSD